MKRYLPCVVFAVVVSTASARPQVLLGQDPFSFGASAAQDPFGAPAAQDPFGASAFQDPLGASAFQNPFGASAPVGGNTGGIPLSDVTGGENPLPVFDGADIDSAGNNNVFGPSDFGTVGLASFDDPFAGTVGLASFDDPFAGTVGLASLDDPFSGTGLSNDLTFGPEAAPVLPTALAAFPVFAPASVPAPAQVSDPFPVPVFTPTSAQAPLSDPVLPPSSPDIANEILSGPVDVLLPSQESVPESVTRSSSIPAFPAGAPEYAPDSTSTGSDSTSAPATVAPPGITLITKANLVYTSFDVAEVNHARDAAALAAAVAGTTGTSAPVAPVAPADPTSVAADTPAAERATPNFSISIDPVLLSDVADITAAPAPADIYLDPTQ